MRLESVHGHMMGVDSLYVLYKLVGGVVLRWN